MALHGSVGLGPLDRGPKVENHRHLTHWQRAARNNQRSTPIDKVGPRANHISARSRAGHMGHGRLVEACCQSKLYRVNDVKGLQVPLRGARLTVAGAKSVCRMQSILRGNNVPSWRGEWKTESPRSPIGLSRSASRGAGQPFPAPCRPQTRTGLPWGAEANPRHGQRGD